MGASNGRTKRSIERSKGVGTRNTGAQTDRQTMQALRLISRAFRDTDWTGGERSLNGEGTFWGSSEPFGSKPTDYGPTGLKRIFLDERLVNHRGHATADWPYMPQSNFYGDDPLYYRPEDARGREITVRNGRGVHSALSNFSNEGPYHALRERNNGVPWYHQDSHTTSRGRPGNSI